MTRAERAAEALRLREQGLIYREIAERMGISVQYAHDLVNDPDGTKGAARKESYQGTCEKCGGPTNGSNGAAAAAKVCQSCLEAIARERHDRVVAAWERGETATAIAGREGVSPRAISSIVQYLRERGESVSLHRLRNREAWPHLERRWNEGVATEVIAAELGITKWSVFQMVQAARAAGVPLARRQRRYSDSTRNEAIALYRSGLTAYEVAAEIGVSYKSVYRWLVDAGVPRRSPGRRKVAA